MRHVLTLTCGLLMFSFTAQGAAASLGAQGEAGSIDAPAQPATDTQTYLAKIDRLLAMAAVGTYGALRRGAVRDLQAARDRIATALGTRATLGALPEDDRLAIQNAEDAISAILRNNEKDRMVCKRVTKTGTRFETSECMTVAQREARAASAAEATGVVQGIYCNPTEFKPCE